MSSDQSWRACTKLWRSQSTNSFNRSWTSRPRADNSSRFSARSWPPTSASSRRWSLCRTPKRWAVTRMPWLRRCTSPSLSSSSVSCTSRTLSSTPSSRVCTRLWPANRPSWESSLLRLRSNNSKVARNRLDSRTSKTSQLSTQPRNGEDLWVSF